MPADDLSAVLAEIREREQAATRGPWWCDESDLCWRLHGVHAVLPPLMEGFPEQVMNHQILKAPKRGTTMAEYWPNEADAAFIVAARTDVPRLLAAVDAALSFHVPEDMEFDNPRVPPFRYCKRCLGHPKWPCPPVTAIRAALTGKGGTDAER